MRFLIRVNRILKLIKDIVEKKLKKLKIVDDELLKKVVLSFTILFTHKSIRFIIDIAEVIESFENRHDFKNRNFNVKSVKKLRQRRIESKLEYLLS